ncbi:MAG: SDR family oxidoreductase [Gammaproteobacteria bacterium]|nr:SDR family oxidoreductase [Gammaproteobacteria bacterium]
MPRHSFRRPQRLRPSALHSSTGKKVLIFGATSAIAGAIAERYASDGATLHLVARNAEQLSERRAHLMAAGAEAVTDSLADLSDLDAASKAVDDAYDIAGPFDIVLLAHGSLSDQSQLESDWRATIASLQTNFLSYVVILTCVATRLETAGSGQIAVIGSVAGDRGRKTNYVYGTAKGGLERLTQGLRNRLSGTGINVLLIKPGFVETPMTESMPKNFLFSTPEKVAKSIQKAISRQRNVVYVPGYWRLIMIVIRAIPEWLFKRMSI